MSPHQVRVFPMSSGSLRSQGGKLRALRAGESSIPLFTLQAINRCQLRPGTDSHVAQPPYFTNVGTWAQSPLADVW